MLIWHKFSKSEKFCAVQPPLTLHQLTTSAPLKSWLCPKSRSSWALPTPCSRAFFWGTGIHHPALPLLSLVQTWAPTLYPKITQGQSGMSLSSAGDTGETRPIYGDRPFPQHTGRRARGQMSCRLDAGLRDAFQSNKEPLHVGDDSN